MKPNRIINLTALTFLYLLSSATNSHASPPEACPLPLIAVAPEYPVEAETQMLSGNVIVEIKINKYGTVSSAFIFAGDHAFFESSIRAAEQWVFKPRKAHKMTTLTFEYVSSPPKEQQKPQFIFFPPNKIRIIAPQALPPLPPQETVEVFERG